MQKCRHTNHNRKFFAKQFLLALFPLYNKIVIYVLFIRLDCTHYNAAYVLDIITAFYDIKSASSLEKGYHANMGHAYTRAEFSGDADLQQNGKGGV